MKADVATRKAEAATDCAKHGNVKADVATRKAEAATDCAKHGNVKADVATRKAEVATGKADGKFKQFEQERTMRYVTTGERIGYERGKQEGNWRTRQDFHSYKCDVGSSKMTIDDATREFVRRRAKYLCEYCHSLERICTMIFYDKLLIYESLPPSF